MWQQKKERVMILKTKVFRRALSMLLVMMTVLSVFSFSAAEVSAADSDIVNITIDNVYRKYRESASFLKLCNEYRAKSNLEAWEMDTELFELAMQKAAELAVYVDEKNLDGSSFLSSSSEKRGLLVGYGVSNNSALLTSFTTDPVYLDYLTSTSFQSAGVGVVEVCKIKYIVVLLSNKTPDPVDSDVLSQLNTYISQDARCKAGYLKDCVMNFKDNDQIVCGGNAVMRLLVHNQRFEDGYAYISGSCTTITSSDTSVFRPNGDGTITGLKEGSSVITMKVIGAPSISASATIKAVAKKFDDCTITKIPDQYYSGNAITPGVTITTSEGVTLQIGKDYTLTYVNNINVGTAVVKITGIGAYAGATAAQNFEIINSPDTFSVSLHSNQPALELGQSATLSASVTNGTAPVKYTFEAAPEGSSSFTTIQASSTASTCTYKPSAAGNYTLRVTAVDNTGKKAMSNIVMLVDTAITITLNLSSTSVTLGNTLTITAKASGGTSPYQFAYYVLEPGNSGYTALASFGSLQTLTYKPTKTGAYQLRVDVKGSNDLVSSTAKGFTVGSTTPTALTNSSSLSATSITLGGAVTMKGAASGGTSPYTYAFYYKKSSAADSAYQTVGTAFGSATTASFTPSEATTYTCKVVVKDSAGTTATKTINLTVNPKADTPTSPLTNNSVISSVNVKAGTTVTITGRGVGGTSPYTYAYYYKLSDATSWTTLGTAFGTATTASFKAARVGTYNVRIIVKDSAGTSVEKTFNVLTTSDVANASTVSATSVTTGTTVTLTGKATGGTTPYTYAYYYKKSTNSAYTTIGTAFSTATSASFKPTEAGTYNVKITVKDNVGGTVDKTFNIVVTAGVTNNSTVSATSVVAGDSVSLTGKASGGTSPYKYAFYYKLSTASSFTTIDTAFGTATTASFKPTAAGTYTVKITVKDNAGATADKTFSVVASEALTNTSTISTTKPLVNAAVTMTGKASGGTSPYKYAFYYKKSADSSYTTIGTAFGTATTASFKPTAAGTYNLKITVKDNAGRTANKTYTVTATAALVNSSTIAATKVTVGSSAKLTGKASGGTSPYKYAFYYKLSSDSSYTTIGTAFGTATTASFKPTAAGTYTVKVTVKDNAGTTTDKTFTVKAAAVLTNKSAISAAKLVAGDKLTLTGKASGGVSPYTYAFYYKRKKNTSWKTIGTAYDTASTAVFQPTAAGEFDIKISVKDSWSIVADKTFSYTAVEPLANNSVLNSTKAAVNNSVVVTAKASGGGGSYKYAYYYKKKESSTYIPIGTEFTTTKSASFKPIEAGDYHIKVSIKDSMNNVKSKALSLSVSDLTNNTTISNGKVGVGTSITITGGAAKGTAPYTYAFYYKKADDTDYTVIGTEFGSSKAVTFKPSAVGSYKIKMSVKDKNGYVSTKVATITATDLGNSSTLDYSKVGIGTAVQITGKATGGTAPYKYAFYFKRSTNTTWNTLGKEFSTTNTATLTPTAAATYNIRVIIKDSDNAVAIKALTLTAADLVNKSTLNANKIGVNNTVRITGKASGGKAAYKYAYYFKRTVNTKWNVLGTEFSSSTSATFTPVVATDYDVKVIVKDSNNVVAIKLFKVTVSDLLNKSTLSASSQKAGKAVTITGKGSGGKTAYKYAFYYKRTENTSWKTLGTEFSTASTATLTPSSAGTFDIKVIVKDANNSVSEKILTYKAT